MKKERKGKTHIPDCSLAAADAVTVALLCPQFRSQKLESPKRGWLNLPLFFSLKIKRKNRLTHFIYKTKSDQHRPKTGVNRDAINLKLQHFVAYHCPSTNRRSSRYLVVVGR